MKIEFYENTHSYRIDGVEVPSVTTLIHDIWMPDKYSNVSKSTLQRAANYGTNVHHLIEAINRGEDIETEKHSYERIAVNRYADIKEEHNIKAYSQEEPIGYIHEGKPLYAGTYDLLADIDGDMVLADIKTTAKYDPKYLSLQLTLYNLALEQTQGIKVDKAYAIWLPKRAYGNLIPVELLDGEQLIKDIINEKC